MSHCYIVIYTVLDTNKYNSYIGCWL